MVLNGYLHRNVYAAFILQYTSTCTFDYVFFKLFFTYVNQLLHSSLYFKVWNRQSCFGKTNYIVFLLIVYIDISFIVTLIITELMADYLLTRAISLYPHYLFLCNRPVWIPINQVTAWFNQMLSYFLSCFLNLFTPMTECQWMDWYIKPTVRDLIDLELAVVPSLTRCSPYVDSVFPRKFI